DGTVIDAGPAQGFGLWVRIRHDDGSITVYGHMYDFFVSVGERVPAGMQIARMGNRATPPARTCTSRSWSTVSTWTRSPGWRCAACATDLRRPTRRPNSDDLRC